MSERYAEALRAHGVNAMLAIVPGLQHDILLEPAALDALTSLVKTLRSR
jgi:acetyl esterase/lipase